MFTKLAILSAALVAVKAMPQDLKDANPLPKVP